jgi:hypothetical protein
VDGPGDVARFFNSEGGLPGAGITVFGDSIYLADTVNSAVRKITKDGTTSTVVRASSVGGDVVFDSLGNMYFASGHAIMKRSTSAQVTVFAGSINEQGFKNDTGTAARLTSPHAMAIDSKNTVYISEGETYTIRKISAAGVVSAFIGSLGNPGHTDGTGDSARLISARGIAVGPGNFVYFTDRTHLIRKASPEGVVTTVAGIAGQRGPLDGPAAEALLDASDLCVAADGTVFFTDRASLVRKISPDGVVSTIGGTTGAPWEWMDATGEAARFQSPSGIALDSNGILYVVDTSNYCVRKGFDPTKYPPVLNAGVNVSAGGALSLSVFGRENVVIEGTSDFTRWYPVHTNRYAGTGLMNDMPNGSFQFFRAVSP